MVSSDSIVFSMATDSVLGDCMLVYKTDELLNKVRSNKLRWKLYKLAYLLNLPGIHPKGACDADDCQECCGEYIGHEFDSSEGGYCINCNAAPW